MQFGPRAKGETSVAEGRRLAEKFVLLAPLETVGRCKFRYLGKTCPLLEGSSKGKINSQAN
jgi:hypothetical protein